MHRNAIIDIRSCPNKFEARTRKNMLRHMLCHLLIFERRDIISLRPIPLYRIVGNAGWTARNDNFFHVGATVTLFLLHQSTSIERNTHSNEMCYVVSVCVCVCVKYK